MSADFEKRIIELEQRSAGSSLWLSIDDLQRDLFRLKNEFREFLKYSKLALSYEHETDNSEPTPQLKTVLKFTPIQE